MNLDQLIFTRKGWHLVLGLSASIDNRLVTNLYEKIMKKQSWNYQTCLFTNQRYVVEFP